MTGKEFELLAPAGSFEIFKAVIEAGADAVYVGGGRFGARAYANNFSEEELLEAIDYAHVRERQVYLTVNTLLKNQEIENELYEYLLPFYERGLDAVIVQDFGVLQFIHEKFPLLPIHTSTQMTVTSVEGAMFLKQYGVTRIVMARELSLEEMRNIQREADIEIEAFVHGAICYCYSGQCLFSGLLGGRSGNRGRCAQPCRLPYSVLDENNREVLKDTYILSLKDMCGIDDLVELHDAGVYSLKIEGRMKQAEYAAGVVSLYRKYIDKVSKGKFNNYKISETDKRNIYNLGNRCGFTDAYFSKHNDSEMITYSKPNYSTGDENYHKMIKEKYVGVSTKIPINGYLSLIKGEEAKLNVYYQNYAVEVTGAIVDSAKNRPLLKDDVLTRMSKTGDTPFEFEYLDVNMDDDIFVPNGMLNKLRRDALEMLKAEVLRKYKSESVPAENKNIECSNTEITGISVSVETKEQLEACLPFAFINRIYIDWNMYKRNELLRMLQIDAKKIVENGKDAFLILPSICRKNTSEFLKNIADDIANMGFSGFVVKNYEELWLVKQYFPNHVVILEHNMYTYNDRAVKAMNEYGVNLNTIPYELNRKEILKRDNRNSEMVLYGFYALMTSAQCVHKNSEKCDKKSCVMYLKDRYKKLFPVKNNCNECYNTIYNSLPFALFNYYKELKDSGISNFRLSFTIEEKRDVTKVLNIMECTLRDGFSMDMLSDIGEFTNGHYKRGVE